MNERELNEAGYIAVKIRTMDVTSRCIEMKISESKTRSRSNRRYANYIENIRIPFLQNQYSFPFVIDVIETAI